MVTLWLYSVKCTVYGAPYLYGVRSVNLGVPTTGCGWESMRTQMSSESDESKPKRRPLTRDRVLATAIPLADAGGLEALSMRTLARELGVGAMALYYHFRNKDELLDGMVDHVFGEIELPSVDEPWKPAMRRRAVSARESL